MTCVGDALVVIRGKTFRRVIRWETTPLVYKAITGITQAGPVVVTAVDHGLTEGWRAAVVSAGGMRQINAKRWPPSDADFKPVSVLSSSTVAFNDVNAADYSAYTSGGYLVYYTPADLTGIEARFQIRATETDETALVSLTELDGIEVDDAAQTITITLEATDTEAYTFDDGVSELEVEDGDGVVTQLLKRPVVVENEVVRD